MFVLGPNDSPVMNNKSDMTATNFNGRRARGTLANTGDYTSSSTLYIDAVENPESIKEETDINGMVNEFERKSEFSYQVNKSDVGSGNESPFVVVVETADLHLAGDGASPVLVPDLKFHGRQNPWAIGNSSGYVTAYADNEGTWALDLSNLWLSGLSEMMDADLSDLWEADL